MRLSKPQKININNFLPAMKSYLAGCPDIAATYLFGSYGTEYQTPLSDVDLAVLFMPDVDHCPERLLTISAELTHIAQEDDINVVVLNSAPITLQFDVIATGRLLFKKETYLEDFIEYVLKHYADYKIDMDTFNEDYDSALREVYANGQNR